MKHPQSKRLPATRFPRPSTSPQTIDEANWYYERPDSIDFIHETRTKEGRHIQTDIINIPWKKLMQSAKRCGRELP